MCIIPAENLSKTTILVTMESMQRNMPENLIYRCGNGVTYIYLGPGSARGSRDFRTGWGRFFEFKYVPRIWTGFEAMLRKALYNSALCGALYAIVAVLVVGICFEELIYSIISYSVASIIGAYLICNRLVTVIPAVYPAQYFL